jgi:lia operon protein LiaG
MFLPACVALLSLAFSHSPTIAWGKSFTLIGRPQIRVASDNVDVRVYASDRENIEAVLYAGRTVSSDAVTDRQSGNRLELDVRIPDQGGAGFGRRSAVLELRIPLRSDIDVRSGNGSVMVKGAEGELTVHTGNGNIEALGINGALNIESGQGDLQIDGIVTAVRLHTRAGNIAAQIDRGSKMNSDWVLRTGDGNVDLRLPEDFSTDLEVDTGDGNVRLDFPMAMIGGGRKSSVRGPINGGGHHLELHSDKGNIVVRKITGSV